MIRVLREHAQRLPSSLWALVLAPSTWAAHFLFCYVYASIHCAKAGRDAGLAAIRGEIGLATIVALAIVAVVAFAAWAQARVAGDPPPHQHATDEDRIRFLGVAGLLLAALSAVAIVFTALPAFLIGDCR